MGELYVEYEYWFAAFQLIFAMLGMGATLTTADFKDVLTEPKSVTVGTLIQLLMVPLIAFVFINSLGLVGGVAIGLALIAAIPGGTTSNIFTHFAKGNIPLSISITAITTLACLITTPLVLSVLITEHLPDSFSMPTMQIVKEIALTLLLPLVVGMVILKRCPTIAPGLSKWSIRLSLLGILAIVIGSSSAGRLDMEAFGTINATFVLVFLVLIAFLGWATARLLKRTQADSTAIEMEVIVRNVNLAVLIKASMFPASNGANTVGDMVLFTVLLYGALQMLIAAAIIFVRRRSTK